MVPSSRFSIRGWHAQHPDGTGGLPLWRIRADRRSGLHRQATGINGWASRLFFSGAPADAGLTMRKGYALSDPHAAQET